MPNPADAASPAYPLAGVRVLDLSRVLAGPWATQLLADLGADVIKIEKPGVGDDTRQWGPPFATDKDGEPSDAAYFLAANRNKRSLAIDLTRAGGQVLIRALAAQSHIVVENFKVGGLKKYGLDYDGLTSVNPALVYCSITGFGQSGPYAARAGYDYLIQAMGGLMSVTGQPEGAPGGAPVKVGVAVADLFAGMYATSSILAALRHAERTGEGAHLDVSLLDCQVAMLANQASNYLVSGAAPKRMGNAHPNIVPYQVFPTKDGHIVIAVGNDGQFKALCDVLGTAELSGHDDFATNPARVRNRDALVPKLTAILKTKPSADWIAALEDAGVPYGPINTIDAVFADDHVKARGVKIDIERDDIGAAPGVAFPVKSSQAPQRLDYAPPALGAHTRDALAEILGLSDDDLQKLSDDGAIG